MCVCVCVCVCVCMNAICMFVSFCCILFICSCYLNKHPLQCDLF